MTHMAQKFLIFVLFAVAVHGADLQRPPAEAFASQPAPVTLKRNTRPVFVPAAPQITISDAATDLELAAARLFEEPLVAVSGGATPNENVALASALRRFARDPEDLSPLEQFVAHYDTSKWSGTLMLNIGILKYHQGRWSAALENWDGAWSRLRHATSLAGKLAADRALGELALMNARLGRLERLQELSKETVGRDVRGAGSENLRSALAGAIAMEKTPGEAYRCGPIAVGRMLLNLKPALALPREVITYPSTSKGTNLAELARLANRAGVSVQMAFRPAGTKSEVPLPAVVHWKVKHFAALTKRVGQDYFSMDVTFGNSTLLSPHALDDEASGYFLVLAGKLPPGWRAVDAIEGETIFGKGEIGPTPPPATPAECVTPDCEDDISEGMATATFELTAISLMVRDTPLRYAPPLGNPICLTVRYNDREAASMVNVSNFGPKWSFDWIAYIKSPTTATTTRFGPGGGQLPYDGFDPNTGLFALNVLSQDRLAKISNSNFELRKPDGSVDLYDLPEAGSNPRIFRTKSVDAHGNTTTFSYDSEYRLRTVTDSVGQLTTLHYELGAGPSDPMFYLVTKVTDPFGRKATFQYDPIGRLSKITDIIGISSEFTYGSGDFITSITTPYGTTQYTKGGSGANDRWLNASDSSGETERAEWWKLATDKTPPAFSQYPAGFPTGGNDVSCSFYWGKGKAKTYPNATVYQWLLRNDYPSTTAPVIRVKREPLEQPVFYYYPTQVDGLYPISTDQPSYVARILDDGTEQGTSFTFNAQGNPTAVVDPLGRRTEFYYASNGIDLEAVKQKNGGGYDILKTVAYNNKHQPVSMTNASGGVTTFTYNSVGQMRSATNPKGETTTFWYHETGQPDPNVPLSETATGYLVKIDGHVIGDADSTHLAYDDFGRVRSVANATSVSATTEYDAFDRPTKITYNGGSFEQFLYNRLDVEWTRDRAGRWTRTLHDDSRKIVAITDPLAQTTTFDWCGCGMLSGMVDPAGNRTSWVRDVQGRVEKMFFGNQLYEKFTYEGNTSRLKARTDAKGQVAHLEYYLDDAIKKISYTDAQGNQLTPATPSVSYTYDSFYPRVASMTDGLGVTHYSYVPITGGVSLGAGQTASIDGPWVNDTLSYTYDELGRVVNTSVNAAANSQTLSYDGLGRPLSLENALGLFSISYPGADSRVGEISYPNGERVRLEYFPSAASGQPGNGNMRLKRIQKLTSSMMPAGTFDLGYNIDGQIESTRNENSAGTVVNTTYEYDPVRRLIAAKVVTAGGEKRIAYDYDRAGNRNRDQVGVHLNTSTHNRVNEISNRTPGGSMEFTGAVNEPAKVIVGGVPADVDPSGVWRGSASVNTGANEIPLVAIDYNNNVTSKVIDLVVSGDSARAMRHDANGNLINDGRGKSFTWDAANRLVAIADASSVREFLYDGNGNRVIERLNGVDQRRWIWMDGAHPVEERDSGNVVTRRFFGSLGEQVLDSNTGMYVSLFYFVDHLGTVREVTDSAGMTRAIYNYAPYGKTTKVSGDMNASFGFAGMYRHHELELNLTKLRVYDSELGRWLSRDPLGERGGINLYAYCFNDPVALVDAEGDAPMLAGALLGAVVGGVLGGGVSIVADVWNNRMIDWGGAGRAALTGAVGGAVAGATFGLAAPAAGSFAMTAVNQGAPRSLATAAGVASGSISGAAGSVAAQGAGMAIGTRKCFSASDVAVGAALGGAFGALGREFHWGNARVAPFGNRVGNAGGTLPHYHRGVPNPTRPTQNLPGQGMGRHRPWDTHPADRSFWDRF